MARTVMARIGMAVIGVACVAMAYMVKAHIAMAHIITIFVGHWQPAGRNAEIRTYLFIAYRAMACIVMSVLPKSQCIQSWPI